MKEVMGKQKGPLVWESRGQCLFIRDVAAFGAKVA
jgi:hypothetical protein